MLGDFGGAVARSTFLSVTNSVPRVPLHLKVWISMPCPGRSEIDLVAIKQGMRLGCGKVMPAAPLRSTPPYDRPAGRVTVLSSLPPLLPHGKERKMYVQACDVRCLPSNGTLEKRRADRNEMICWRSSVETSDGSPMS